ncbi:MAG TPA: flotillin [Microscillaceae bacterium]|nr:flotillin [Microscillaceae bacterium]
MDLILLIGGGVLLFLVIAFFIAFSKWYKKVPQGKALIRTGRGGVKVSFDKGMMVYPVLHKMEIMDISIKSFTISRTGKEGLICKDNMRADIRVNFFIRVNNTPDAVKKVANAIGVQRASDESLLIELFEARFSEALKTVGKSFDFVELYDQRERFKQEMLEISNKDLGGYSLENAAIDYLEQTSVDALNPDNILDAEGIEKIVGITSAKMEATKKRENEKKAEIGRLDTEMREKELAYEKDIAIKEAAQKTEISTTEDREEHERIKVREEMARKNMEEEKKTGQAEKLEDEKNARELMKAEKLREKEEVKEVEDVKKQQELSENKRLEEVEKAQIEKEKILERERKEIQELIRQRVEVERETVQEEEKIKDTRAHADVDRKNQVAMKERENEAEVALVEQIKAAEAAQKAAELKSQQLEIEAQTRLKVTKQDAESKKLMADAQAEESASLGLAEARVMEAKAQALEDQGTAEANIIEKKSLAEAKGIEAQKAAENAAYEEKGKIEARLLEEQGIAESKVMEIKAESEKKQQLAMAEAEKAKGLVEAEVEEAKAEARKKAGVAEAQIEEAKAEAAKKAGIVEAEIAEAKAEATKKAGFAEAEVLRAKAESEKARGLVEAEIAEAKAEALRKQGLAEAEAMEAKALIDAKQTAAKAEALKKMEGIGKEFEEFRLKLEKDTKVELAGIEIQKAVAEAQAAALAEAFKNSKIDIVGGETMFYENIMNVIRRGKTLDTFVNGSQTLSELKGALLNGEGASFIGKLRDFVSEFKISAQDVKDLSISALILKMSGLTENVNTQKMLTTLLDMAKKVGLADEKASKLL